MLVIMWKYLKKFRNLLAFPLQNVVYCMKLNRNMLLGIQKERIFLEEFLYFLNWLLLFFMIMVGWEMWEISLKFLSSDFLSEAQWMTGSLSAVPVAVVGPAGKMPCTSLAEVGGPGQAAGSRRCLTGTSSLWPRERETVESRHEAAGRGRIGRLYLSPPGSCPSKQKRLLRSGPCRHTAALSQRIQSTNFCFLFRILLYAAISPLSSSSNLLRSLDYAGGDD